MRNIVLILALLVFLPVLTFGQELKLTGTMVSTGGTAVSERPVSFSKWRLGTVHQLKLGSNDSNAIPGGKIIAYPNPVIENLNIKFNIPERGDYVIEINDLLGQKLFYQVQKNISPGDAISFDMSTYAKGMYLIVVSPTASYTKEIFKIQK